MGNRYEVVITSDRTMMSNHHGKEFLGFVATGPPIALPERLWMWIAAPKLNVDNDGRPIEAPYGLRKVEAKLIDEGFNAAIIDPDYLDKYVDSMKVLMIGHHDYFAYGSPSVEWWIITGVEPLNRRSFLKFMEAPAVRRARKRGVKIIVGGPAAWQWLYELHKWRMWGVSTVIDGEAEGVVAEVVEKAINGEDLPDYIYVGPHEAPSVSEIPVIKGASINGLVEIMRGCPRGCRFCSVTLRPLRHIPLDKILKEVKVNVAQGVKSAILHSEDVLLYGAKGIKPEPEQLIKLHKEVANIVPGYIAWSHCSLATLKYSEDEYGLISKLMHEVVLQKQEYLGVEVGIETLSPRLAKIVMPAKSAPYPAEKWPEVVEDSFNTMHENKIVPAATLILGLPQETPDDVAKTAEYMDRLKPYRSIIVPMFFVPMGFLKNTYWFRKNMMTQEHVEVMKKCLSHSLYWARDIMNRFYLKEPYLAPVRLGLKIFMRYVEYRAKRIIPGVEANVRG